MEQVYATQIRQGCNKKCMRVFCNLCCSEKCIRSLSHVLAEYGGTFLCENITKTVLDSSLSAKHMDRGCVVLSLYFYLAGLSEEHAHHSMHIEVGNQSKAAPFLAACDEGSMARSGGSCTEHHLVDRDTASVQTEDDGRHIYCKFFTQNNLEEEDVHLMEGLLYLILERFRATSSAALKPFSIRIFNIVSRYKKVKMCYLHTLLDIYLSIRSMCKEAVDELDFSMALQRSPSCIPECICVVHPRLTLDDYTKSVGIVLSALESTEKPNIRECSFVEAFLKILKALYIVNEKIRVYSYEHFYLHSFSKRIDVNEEFKCHKRGEKSIFEYTFILPLSKKSDFIKYENNDLVKESLQETFFRALFEGEKVPYLFIRINRKTIYSETLNLLKRTPNFDLRKQVKVTFNNEEGQDQGGIKKEYFQLLSEEIREERRLFEHKNRTLWFRLGNSGVKSEFESIGKIIGIALYNNVVLNLPFPTLFFKRLLNKDTELNDLREIEPAIFSSLCNMRRLSTHELELCDQTFEITYESNGRIQRRSLIKNGQAIRVTEENIEHFVERYSRFLTSDSVEPYMRSIRKGFLAVIQPTSFEFLHAKELEKIIVGSKYIDIQKLKEVCIYRGYNSDSDIITWFWEIVEEYDTEMREKLLQFCTGNDRIPVTAKSIKFAIMRNGCDTENLPSAQTCFNILMIPKYSTKEKLAQKLNVAINYTKGFFLV